MFRGVLPFILRALALATACLLLAAPARAEKPGHAGLKSGFRQLGLDGKRV